MENHKQFSPDWGRCEESYKNQPNDDDGMRWWHLKNMFEEESVELGNLPEDNQLTNGKESHVRTFRIHPAHCRPTFRCKLECSAF